MSPDLAAAALLLVEAEAIMRAAVRDLLDEADDREARGVADGMLRFDAQTLTTYTRQLRTMSEVAAAMAKEPAQ